MPKVPKWQDVVLRVEMSIDGLRQAEEGLQELEQVCHDPAERKRIRDDWNDLESMQDRLREHVKLAIRLHSDMESSWALGTLRSEPTTGQLRDMAKERRLRAV